MKARIIRRDYDSNTEQLIEEIEIKDLVSIMADCEGDNAIIVINTKDGITRAFTDDFCSSYTVEFC